MRIRLLLLMVFLMLAACAKHPAPTIPNPQIHPVKSVQTMLTGIDQFDGGAVWGVNTGHGAFVVGPEVPGGVKSMLYERLIEAHESVVTIRYVDMPQSKGIAAHRRIRSITIQEREYRLDY